MAVVDGQHPVLAADDVDGVRPQLGSVVGRGRLHREQREMELALELRQVGPPAGGGEARRQRRLEVQRFRDRLEVLAGLPIDIDPQEAPFA